MKRRHLLSLLFLPHSLSAQEKEAEWKTYTNARFGFAIDYPASLESGRESDNGDGKVFKTADGKFELRAYAHFLQVDDGDSLDKRWKEELAERGDTVTYKKKGDTWFVVSGVQKDGTEYYRKLAVEKGNWATFLATYPHTENKKYDSWVAKIEKSFKPFLKGDHDRSE